ncbi:hypothetical protein [Prochlorococcus marinus]|uniref:hypothetical protein n=1 Tax=Prochlorococcus marinus TaxID=1219 RepID=UPI0007B38DDD|nr:hypothetical protein [Prochlorococcus marinus]
MNQYKYRTPCLDNQIGNRECLAYAGRTQKSLTTLTSVHNLNQTGNLNGLITLWAISRREVALAHQSANVQPIILFRVKIK